MVWPLATLVLLGLTIRLSHFAIRGITHRSQHSWTLCTFQWPFHAEVLCSWLQWEPIRAKECSLWPRHLQCRQRAGRIFQKFKSQLNKALRVLSRIGKSLSWLWIDVYNENLSYHGLDQSALKHALNIIVECSIDLSWGLSKCLSSSRIWSHS